MNQTIKRSIRAIEINLETEFFPEIPDCKLNLVVKLLKTISVTEKGKIEIYLDAMNNLIAQGTWAFILYYSNF